MTCVPIPHLSLEGMQIICPLSYTQLWKTLVLPRQLRCLHFMSSQEPTKFFFLSGGGRWLFGRSFRKVTIPSWAPLVISVEKNSPMMTTKVELKDLSANCIYWHNCQRAKEVPCFLERSKQNLTDCHQHKLHYTKVYYVLLFSWCFGTRIPYQIPCSCH